MSAPGINFQAISRILCASLLLAGCGTTLTGYPFSIHGVYQATRSNLKITIDTLGHVPPGADTSDDGHGAVLVEPISPPGDKVHLIFSEHPEFTYRIGSSGPKSANWGFRDREASLISILTSAGYRSLDDAEIAEIVQVIGGALAGPKTVRLDGQTEHLKVMDVQIGRHPM